jgi:hypothetical protein
MYNIKNILDEFIKDWKTKDTVKIEELRWWIKKLSKYKVDDKEYKKILSEFEKSLIDSTRLSWEEYINKLLELQKIFMKMYLKYGQ